MVLAVDSFDTLGCEAGIDAVAAIEQERERCESVGRALNDQRENVIAVGTEDTHVDFALRGDGRTLLSGRRGDGDEGVDDVVALAGVDEEFQIGRGGGRGDGDVDFVG